MRNMQNILAIFVVVGFFIMSVLIVRNKLDQSDHDIMYMLLGVLGSNFSQIYQYYFGKADKKND